MASPSESPEPYTQAEVEQIRGDLSRLSPQHVSDYYASAHRECSPERKPSAKAIQRLVVAWKILARWNWR